MPKSSSVSEILELKEIPPSEEEDDDEDSRISKQVSEERRKQQKCIIAIYKKRFGGNGKGRGTTLNLDYGYELKRKEVLDSLETEYAPEREYAKQHRPKKRAECKGGERPCPWVSCHYHLATDITDVGSIKLNFPNLEPGDELPEIDFDDMLETCALDVADEEGRVLEEIGIYINLTRERIRQYEEKALAKLERSGVLNKLLNP